MKSVAVYDTKPYDRQYFEKCENFSKLNFKFLEFRLSSETCATVKGFPVVCAFVNDHIDQACIRTLKDHEVKLIALRCAGFNNVDLAEAKKCGIHVVRVPSYSPHAVAEHAVGLLLTLNRKIHRAFYRVREHNFSLNGLVGFDLYNKTVGIIGTGKIGRIAAQIFKGFGSKVLAYDPVPSHEWASPLGIEYVPLEKLLSTSDVISLHLPLSPQTVHLLNADAFAKMKTGVYIINTSRGKLVDTQAIIKVLKTGKLGGVCLDVYEEEEGVFFEDLSDKVLIDDDLSRLLSFPNVLITSHQAFLTQEALSEIARVTMENILRFESSKPFLDGTLL
jgi:D-lactate dehydrogenase